MEEKVLLLITTFLGDYGKHSGDWYSFNCPECAAEKGVISDDKYNLEVTIDLDVKGCGGFHCWRCKDSNNMSGTLSSLFKRYASREIIEEFRKIVNDYRSSRLYELHDGAVIDEFSSEEEFFLPDGFKPIRSNDKGCHEALKYLHERGINDNIIKRYNIGYVGDYPELTNRNRIIIPSYNSYDSLNYWVGRDYTGRSKLRYKNPKIEKSKLIFNEGKINWYEPITLVEGPFDHIVVPNSIPLLGKTLSKEYVLFKTLVSRSKFNVNIFLDGDAVLNAKRIYKLLNESELHDRVYFIECPEGYDASLIYQYCGVSGIIGLMSHAKKINDCDLVFLK